MRLWLCALSENTRTLTHRAAPALAATLARHVRYCDSMHRVEQLVDSSLGPLLREDCDETAFVKGVLDAHGTGACLEALSGGSQVLGAELGDQVSARYEQLLSEVHAVQALEAKLLRNNERVARAPSPLDDAALRREWLLTAVSKQQGQSHD